MANGVTPYEDGQVYDDQDANLAAGFGDGSDGAFNETASSTTNLVQGTVHQHTSFNLGSAHTLSASSTSDEPIIIYVSGNATIDGTIDLAGKGNPDGAGYYDRGAFGTTAENFGFATGGAFVTSGGSILGRKGGIFFNFQQNQKTIIMNGTGGRTGAGTGDPKPGGGGGASSSNDGTAGTSPASTGTGTGGAGGPGGCTIIMIIGGTLTFGASSSIDVSGTDGANGVSGNAGGGGGGGSGDILIFHRGNKTDSGLTTDVSASAAGTGSGTGGTGGTGGAGFVKIVNYDTIFWGK